MTLPTPPNGFWKVIAHINWKELAKNGGDTELARKRMLEKTNTPQSVKFIKGDKNTYPTLQEFHDYFDSLISLINDETSKRIDNGLPSFAKSVDHGGDDCHFMDMPAHLVGLGEKAVEGYLKGYVIKYEVTECLSYMFQH